MAIEIIEWGTPPADVVYEAQCRTCRSRLRFKRQDAKYTADQREGDFLTVSCPVCNSGVHVSAFAAIRE